MFSKSLIISRTSSMRKENLHVQNYGKVAFVIFYFFKCQSRCSNAGVWQNGMTAISAAVRFPTKGYFLFYGNKTK
jgi:hypothetical protein